MNLIGIPGIRNYLVYPQLVNNNNRLFNHVIDDFFRKQKYPYRTLLIFTLFITVLILD